MFQGWGAQAKSTKILKKIGPHFSDHPAHAKLSLSKEWSGHSPSFKNPFNALKKFFENFNRWIKRLDGLYKKTLSKPFQIVSIIYRRRLESKPLIMSTANVAWTLNTLLNMLSLFVILEFVFLCWSVITFVTTIFYTGVTIHVSFEVAGMIRLITTLFATK